MRLTVAQFATHAGVCAETVRRLIRRDAIPARRIGNKWFIDSDRADRALSLKGGNGAEREITLKGI
jgi:hypothetical protein